MVLFRGAETHTRSVLKALSWRTLGTLDTFAISWILTGKVEIAGSIAGLEIITKIAWYYLHERVWAAIPWADAGFDGLRGGLGCVVSRANSGRDQGRDTRMNERGRRKG